MKKHTYILPILKNFTKKCLTLLILLCALGQVAFGLNSPAPINPARTASLMPSINAGADQDLCEGDTAQLDGSFSMIGKIQWLVLNENGMVGDSTDTTSYYVPMGNITAIRLDTLVIVEDTTGLGTGQTPLRDTVVFTIHPQIEIQNASRDTILCAGDSLGRSIQLAGTFNQLSWAAARGTFTDTDSAQTIYISPNIAVSSVLDTLILTAKDTNNRCAAVLDTSIVHLFGPVRVNAGADTSICSTNSLRLNASLEVDTLAASWSVLHAAGTFNNVNRLNARYSPSPLQTVSRTDTLILTLKPLSGALANCVYGADTLVVTIQSPPSVELDPDTVMLGETTLDINAALSRPVETSVWFSKNGLFSPSSTHIATYVPNALGTATNRTDTITYRGELENEVCPAALDTILVTIIPAPIIARDGVNPLCDRFCVDTIFRNLDINTASAIVLANDLNPTDTCGSDNNYMFKIWMEDMGVAAPTDVLDLVALPSSLALDCSDRGTQNLDIYITDGFTEVSYCPTTMEVSDIFASCGERTVSGYITTPNGQPLKNVEVRISGEGVIPFPTTTDANGRYEFVLQTDKAYHIIPQRNTILDNGITTYDILLTNRHILHLEDFTSPYQLIAADVNKSYTVTSFDLATTRKLILGLTQTFPNNVSWRFVPADYIFQNSLNARIENFPEHISIPLQTGHLENQNFIAVKVGDPSGDVDLTMDANGFTNAEPRKRPEAITFQTKDLQLVKGQVYKVPFYLLNAKKVAGYQFTLAFKGLELLEIQEGIAQKEHFGQHLKNRGILTTSWETTSLQNSDNQWFILQFKAKRNGLLSEALAINSAVTPAEAYNQELEILDVNLQFEQEASMDFALFQNRPNPFSKETLIGFTLPKTTHTKLTILDVQGKVLLNHQKHYPQGYNEVQLNLSSFPKGIFYYQLETEFGVKTQKMMRL